MTPRRIGILTAGGDSPGLNAAIRAVGKSAIGRYGMRVVGIRDGFRGLVENRVEELESEALAGILTRGGTILGTSRDKPHKLRVGDQTIDMTARVCENYANLHLDALVCLGGGGTHSSAQRLLNAGLNIITLPKTIDNDIAHTDTTIGFDTALSIATEAIDRLHSTAHSHHRIIVVQIMGHNAGWLTLGAGLASGADVVLIPELPYDVEYVAESIRQRSMGGHGFSIVAVAERAKPRDPADLGLSDAESSDGLEFEFAGPTLALTRRLETLTRLEARLTILGHVQRGGTPTAADRALATRLGTAGADALAAGAEGVMVAARGEDTALVDVAEVAGQRKTVPLDHPWILAARDTGLCLGAPLD